MQTFFSLLPKTFLSVISVRRFNELVRYLYKLNSIPLPRSSSEISVTFIFYLSWGSSCFLSNTFSEMFNFSHFYHQKFPLIQAKLLYLCTIIIDWDCFMKTEIPKRILKLQFYTFTLQNNFLANESIFTEGFKSTAWRCSSAMIFSRNKGVRQQASRIFWKLRTLNYRRLRWLVVIKYKPNNLASIN
jgi:hypothetical protein